MKLCLALYLLSSYFCSVSMLQCLKCYSESGQCNTTISEECEPEHICGSLTYSLFEPGLNVNTTVQKLECIRRNNNDLLNTTATEVLFYSANVGLLYGSVLLSSCEFDNCNRIVGQFNSTPNGLKCLTCDSYSDEVCNSILSCVGYQDHCLSVIRTHFNINIFPWRNKNIFGCASKTVCDRVTKTSIFGEAQCCIDNLCNRV
ncbi:uncharacterized protein LOC128615148 [Ictalurus furcatus]|uniref:uncharacterized protein LOC128615148 n=1 Tax=Ictalurus furcatus TaxID=66913 RepID=UPI0023505EEF|nr:uncharacterized protein LOC128615148 [Ictalurus furcatus]